MTNNYWNYQADATQVQDYQYPPAASYPPPAPCPQEPGTLLRIFIPAGAVINLANLFEVSSPSGVCLLVRLPLLGGGLNANSVLEAIRQAGGTVEFQ